MIDDNVFYQDSVRMAQRFIELKKDNWELASYPLERHGFVHPEAWYDEYRRIYQLFERTLKQ
jgi:dipeptidyl aminopeptidase/acylaminoacyl peptidase